jgi:MYXO-CTERM domain-containing protein
VKRNLLGVLIVASALVFLPTSQALAVVITIDFEDVPAPPGGQLNLPDGVSGSSRGFLFTPGSNNDSGLNDLHFHNEDGFGLNGTINMGTHDDVVMTRVGGGTFSLLDFQFQGNITEPESFFLHGVREGGATFSVTFLTDNLPSPTGVVVPYETFTTGDAIPLADFTNLISLTWEVTPGDPYGFNGFFLDNIRVDVAPNGAPEPAGVSLLLLGLAALHLRRRS